MQAIQFIEAGTAYLNAWTTDGTPLGNFCVFYAEGTLWGCDSTTQNTMWWDISAEPLGPVLFVARLTDTGDCSALGLSDCAQGGNVSELATVSTSTPGYQVSTTYTYSTTTTSTSSPPSYHNVISADGVVIGGLMLIVILLLAWKRS